MRSYVAALAAAAGLADSSRSLSLPIGLHIDSSSIPAAVELAPSHGVQLEGLTRYNSTVSDIDARIHLQLWSPFTQSDLAIGFAHCMTAWHDSFASGSSPLRWKRDDMPGPPIVDLTMLAHAYADGEPHAVRELRDMPHAQLFRELRDMPHVQLFEDVHTWLHTGPYGSSIPSPTDPAEQVLACLLEDEIRRVHGGPRFGLDSRKDARDAAVTVIANAGLVTTARKVNALDGPARSVTVQTAAVVREAGRPSGRDPWE